MNDIAVMFMHELWGNSLFCLHGNGSFPGSIAVHRAIILLPPREEKINLMCVLRKLHVRAQKQFSGGDNSFFFIYLFYNTDRLTVSNNGTIFKTF